MKEEIKYLSEKINEKEYNLQRDLDYGYTGKKIDEQLEHITLLQNILTFITD